MKKQLSLLLVGSILFWVLTLVPAYRHGGWQTVGFASIAAALCLAPTLTTLIWAGQVADQSPEQQLFMVLGGTGIRMAFVLGFGMALSAWLPEYRRMGFWVWVLIFYLVTLTLEILLLIALPRSRRKANPPIELPR